MENNRHHGEESGAPRCSRRARRGWAAAALLSVVGLGLLPLQSGQAQGYAPNVIRQLQARLEAVTQQQRQQLMMVQRLNATHAAELQRLQRFQAAVNAAAAAGDPTAVALRANTPEAVLDKLTTQFNARSRKQPAGSAAVSTEIPAPDLSGARLSGAVLLGVKLARASLKGTDLTKADLRNSVLRGADLHGAKLQGANLMGADLTQADLTNALYDDTTRWPTGFDPQKHGGLLVH
jgi:uncharacterized protein YjbI with pentapeptide repeats